MFRTVFNIYEKRYRCFCSRELPKRHFQLIVLVNSNWPRASRWSNFEITRATTPRIVLLLIQLMNESVASF